MYKERKETTHREIGEEYIHTLLLLLLLLLLYIKDKHNVYKHGHKIGVQEAKRSS